MENEHVIGGLTRKRAEIAGQIEHAQATLRKLVTELDTIDSVIRIFDPETDIGAIKAKAYPPRHAAVRGEMMRHVMGCLRMASEPVTSRDIATVVMKARGLNPDDAELAVTIRKRVGACMWKLKQSGYAREVPIAGDLKGWVKPSPIAQQVLARQMVEAYPADSGRSIRQPPSRPDAPPRSSRPASPPWRQG